MPEGNGFIGRPLQRKEDERLLTGAGRFSADIAAPSMAYAVMVRSPYPHARIGAVDAARARTMPGVLGVFDGAQLPRRRTRAHSARAGAFDQV